MKRKHRAFITVVLSLTAVLAAWPVRGAAQDVEIGALLGWNFPGLDTTYTHSFVPQFTAFKPYTGSGGQTIHVQGISGLGLGAYFNIAMRDHLLLQFSYTPFSSDIQGYSSDYTVSVNYSTSKPPDTPPQQFNYTYTSDGWQAIGGTMKDKAYSMSLIYRLGTSETIAADLIAGLTYFHFSGSTQAMGFTRFWLDEVGQLHSEDYSLWLDFGPKDTWGGNVGAALNIHFNSNFGLVFQGRYFLAVPVKATIGFRMISLEGLNETVIYPNKERIDKNEFKVNASFLSLQGGFKVMF